MNASATLAAWAPEGARWARFCKPVLFAFLEEELRLVPRVPLEPELDLARLLPVVPDATAEPSPHPYRPGVTPPPHALVVDLPGHHAIGWGVALARAGFRPVPLFNSMPGPRGTMPEPYAELPISLVDVRPIMDTLAGAAPILAAIDLHPEAPPAFLLDAARHQSNGQVIGGRYDNRALSLPSDFPSGRALAQAGVRHVVAVSAKGRVAWDLVETLSGWRGAGLAVSAYDVAAASLRPWRRPFWRPLAALARHSVLATFHGGHGAGPFGDRVPPGVG